MVSLSSPLFFFFYFLFSSPPLFFFFFPPFMDSTLYFKKFKIHPLSILVCAPHCPFLFAHTLLPRWNSGMTTKTKIVQVRACQTCFMWEVSVLCTQNIHLTIHHFDLFLSFSFWPLKLGLPIFLKLNAIVFFKLN